MAPPRKHDDETRLRVIEMYKAGDKIDSIITETGVPRSTIFLILKEVGEAPSRLPAVARRAGAEGVAFIMERLLETHAELVEARQEIARLSLENSSLTEKLKQARARAKGGQN